MIKGVMIKIMSGANSYFFIIIRVRTVPINIPRIIGRK